MATNRSIAGPTDRCESHRLSKEQQAREAFDELGRGNIHDLVDVELHGSVACSRGVDKVALSGVRGVDLRLKPGLLGRRPGFADLSVTNSRFAVLTARGADFVGLRIDRVRVNGPFKAFEDCSFTDVVAAGMVFEERFRFDRCRLVNCRIDVHAAEGILFNDCTLDGVTFSGAGDISTFGTTMSNCDARDFDLSISILEVSGEADLSLPARPDCFFVPRSALEGPLSSVIDSLQSDALEAVLRPASSRGSVLNAADLRRLDPSGVESERVLEAFWPYHVENLAGAH